MKHNIQSTKENSIEAIKKLASQLKMDKISFILFFASSQFDFKEVHRIFTECYPDTVVVGATSQGELVEEGYSDGYLTAISVYGEDFEVEPMVLESVKRKALLYRKQVKQVINKMGIDLTKPDMENKFFAISLIDALSGAEEKLSMMLSAAFDEKDIHLVGASCGCLTKNECYLSLNGTIYQDVAILLFVRTHKKVIVYNENIYAPFGERHRVTSADIANRTVNRVDGEPIEKIYKEALRVDRLNESVFATHPIGRITGGKAYIASPIGCVAEGGIQFYTRVMPGSSFKFMEAVDPVIKGQETTAWIQKEMRRPSLILAFSCILRYIQFKEQHLTGVMYKELSKNAPVFGITTLGEQIGLTPVNQTLTLLAIED